MLWNTRKLIISEVFVWWMDTNNGLGFAWYLLYVVINVFSLHIHVLIFVFSLLQVRRLPFAVI